MSGDRPAAASTRLRGREGVRHGLRATAPDEPAGQQQRIDPSVGAVCIVRHKVNALQTRRSAEPGGLMAGSEDWGHNAATNGRQRQRWCAARTPCGSRTLAEAAASCRAWKRTRREPGRPRLSRPQAVCRSCRSHQRAAALFESLLTNGWLLVDTQNAWPSGRLGSAQRRTLTTSASDSTNGSSSLPGGRSRLLVFTPAGKQVHGSAAADGRACVCACVHMRECAVGRVGGTREGGRGIGPQPSHTSGRPA